MIEILPVNYPPPGMMTTRPLSQIADFVIHHTAGPADQTPQQIDEEHRAEHDAMIAYNWVITQDGKVYAGRPVEYVSAATFGRNPESVAVVLVGDFQANDERFTGEPTEAQIASLKELCLWAHRSYPTILRTYGHGDVAELFYANDTEPYATDCPGDKLEPMIADVKTYVRDNLAKR